MLVDSVYALTREEGEMTDERPPPYQARVRAHQTDLNGAMHHAAFLDLFDDARIETYRLFGYDYEWMQTTGLRPVIRRIDCEYFTPAFMDDLLTVSVSVPQITRATMTIRYQCRRDDELLAIGHAVFVFVDERGKPARVPQEMVPLAHGPLAPPPAS
jgi:acyl-CoA thioester hydrolase